jgi:hypothetical protein
MTDKNGNPLHTTSQVADMLGKAPSTVRAARQEHALGRKVGRDWLYSESDIQKLKAYFQQRHRGRPHLKRRCGRCHICGAKLQSKLDGEEWCPDCGTYRRYPSHGWTRAVGDDARWTECPPPVKR